ncbi:hypothetical protein Mapa_013653 [Marchantia paleacea]|nr:hypothetical protein Mapa_013653 [Marchantia paleacea]
MRDLAILRLLSERKYVSRLRRPKSAETRGRFDTMPGQMSKTRKNFERTNGKFPGWTDIPIEIKTDRHRVQMSEISP